MRASVFDRSPEGRAGRSSASRKDTTDQIRAEELMAASGRYRAIVSQATASVAQTDLAAASSSSTSASATSSGYDQAELLDLPHAADHRSRRSAPLSGTVSATRERGA